MKKMKKITLLSLVFLGILVFSGCYKKDTETTPAITEQPVIEENQTASPNISPEIETSVENLKNYNSSDELLNDIDTALEDLDNL
jgi:PBP1b-binding outer membrane lipoprotein LpoB